MRLDHRWLLVVASWIVVVGCGDDDGMMAPTTPEPPPAPPAMTDDAAVTRDAGPRIPDTSVVDPPVDAGPRRDPEMGSCWEGRWCWVEGAPVGTIDGASIETVYAADDGGRLWHWEGATWELVDGLDDRRVRRVHVGAGDDLWVIAQHRDAPGFSVDRFDGRAWSTVRENVDPRALTGFGSDNVWVRDRETLGWLRFDGRDWQEVEMPDPTRVDVAFDGLYAKLMPGPAPTAYAITTSRIDPTAPPPQVQVVSVWRFDGAQWTEMGPITAGWAELAFADGEVRVVQYEDAGSSELRFDGEAWVETRFVASTREPDAHWLAGSQRGVSLVPSARQCLDILPMGDEMFCTMLAWGGQHGTSVGHVDARGEWSDTTFPGATRPLAPELFDDVSPGYWALGSRRAWGNGPNDVLRVVDGGESWEPGVLQRIRDGVAENVIGPEERLVYARQIDGVAREDAWVAADGSIYRVSGTRAELVPVPRDLGWFQTHAITAVPGGAAWALATESSRSVVLRITENGAGMAVDHEVPNDFSTDEHIELHDIAVADDGDVWVLASVGRRSGYGVLLHRRAAVRCGPAWSVVRLWDEAFGARQVVHHGDALYISGVYGAWNEELATWIGGSSVVRIPTELLQGDVVDATVSEVALDAAPERLADGQISTDIGTDLSYYDDAELWVGASGVWLTTPAGARRFVEPR